MIQYPCPKCGKVLVLSGSDAGQVVLCNACGAQVRVPRSAAPVAPAPAPSPSHSPRAATKPRPATPGWGWWAMFAAAIVIAAGVPVGILISRGGRQQAATGRVSNSANVRENADLLSLKSEAEALAINGKLAEAHAKYRELQNRAATRDIKD